MIDFGGFEASVQVATLWRDGCSRIPDVKGVYAVLFPDGLQPSFLGRSPAGHFKGKNPTLGVVELQERWVAGTAIIYIGQAGGRRGQRDSKATLRERLRDLLRYGAGKAVGHEGGRALWQIKQAGEFLIRWRQLPGVDPRVVECGMIADFKREFGKRPYANKQC